MRQAFCDKATTSAVSLTYTAPFTIARGAGSFVSDGWLPGMVCTVSGTASNNGRFLVFSVSALSMSVNPWPAAGLGPNIVNEGPVSSSLAGVFLDADGMERWPVAKVRASGFTSGIVGINGIPPASAGVFPFLLSCNGFAHDEIYGTDQFDWCVIQRTDTTASRYLRIERYDEPPTNTFSGTIIVFATPLAQKELGFTKGAGYIAGSSTVFDSVLLSADQTLAMMRNVHVYVQRKADRAIQWIDYTAKMALAVA